jgi:hypothetical protein
MAMADGGNCRAAAPVEVFPAIAVTEKGAFAALDLGIFVQWFAIENAAQRAIPEKRRARRPGRGHSIRSARSSKDFPELAL